MLKDQCEELNVTGEEKFYCNDYVRVTRATLKANKQSVPVNGFCISCVLSYKVEVKVLKDKQVVQLCNELKVCKCNYLIAG